MPITFHCPGCGTAYTVPDAVIGRSTRCKQCSTAMVVPGASAQIQLQPAPLPVLAVDAEVPEPMSSSPHALAGPTPSRLVRALVLGGIPLAACAVLAFLGWYLLLRRTQPDLLDYLPDQTNVVIYCRMSEMLESEAWRELTKASPELIERLQQIEEEDGSRALPETDVEETVQGGRVLNWFGSRPVSVIRAKRDITAKEVLKNLKDGKYKQTTVGKHECFEFEESVSAPLKGEGATQRSETMLCVLGPRLLVWGHAPAVREVLTRDRKPAFSPELKQGLELVDFAQPVVVVADVVAMAKETREGGSTPPTGTELLKAITVQIGTDDGVQVKARIVCPGDKQAEDLQALMAFGVTMLKNNDDVPGDVRKVLEDVVVRQEASAVLANVKLESSSIEKLAKLAESRQAKGPVEPEPRPRREPQPEPRPRPEPQPQPRPQPPVFTPPALPRETPADITLPQSQPSRRSVGGAPVQRAGLKVTPLNLNVGNDRRSVAPPCLCWTPDSQGFYFLEGENGTVSRIALAGFTEQRRLEIGRKCGWMALSRAGLLVAASDLQEVWILDPLTLEVMGRVVVPGVTRLTASPQSTVAFAGGRNGLFGVDLVKKELTCRVAGSTPAMTPDGKYLFTYGGIEQITRYRIEGGTATLEETSQRIGQGNIVYGICVSPDSRYVCLPAGGGNYRNLPNHPEMGSYGTYVYPVGNINRPAFTLNQGAYPNFVGFDPAAGLVYGQSYDKQLIVFTDTGVRKADYSFGRGFVRQMLVHPQGRRLLLYAEAKPPLVYIELPKN